MDITPENKNKIIALLREGICPICGKKGFSVPLSHVNRVHGIDRVELKQSIGIGLHHTFTTVECHEALSTSAKRNKHADRINSTVRQSPDVRQERQLRPVTRIDPVTGETVNYRSVSEAARNNNVTKQAISSCILGRTRTCKGYVWVTN